MQQQVDEPVFTSQWASRFPGQIYTPQPTPLAQPLPADKTFLLDGRHALQAIEVGHADTYDSTVLWVPDLKLAVCGDVVYGQVHQMLYEANTEAKRAAWIRAIGIVEGLGPAYVVPGHKQAEEIDGVWHLAATKRYIEDFGAAVARKPKNARALFAEMMALYPDRLNPGAAQFSCAGAFLASKETRL